MDYRTSAGLTRPRIIDRWCSRNSSSKETLADHLRVDTLEQSRQLGAAATAVLYSVAGKLLRAGVAPTEAACRYVERHRRGERHPCHVDDGRQSIDWERYDVMALGVPTLLIDATDGYRPDYPDVVAFIDSHRWRAYDRSL